MPSKGFTHEAPVKGQSDIWLTPRHIIEALGPFDLDPCAAPSPRPWPTAAVHYDITQGEDGLMLPWGGGQSLVQSPVWAGGRAMDESHDSSRQWHCFGVCQNRNRCLAAVHFPGIGRRFVSCRPRPVFSAQWHPRGLRFRSVGADCLRETQRTDSPHLLSQGGLDDKGNTDAGDQRRGYRAARATGRAQPTSTVRHPCS